MTPKRKPVVRLGAAWDDGSPTCESKRHHGAVMATHTAVTSHTRPGLWKFCRSCAEEFAARVGCKMPPEPRPKPAPLPRAVRELLRDVVLWHRTEDDSLPSSEDMAKRAERILGVPWERIVAKARKAGRR